MACFCHSVMILKDIQQLNFHRWSFFIQVYIQQEKLLLLCPPLRSLVEYLALALYLIIVFIPFYLIKMKALTYTSYREHCKLYAEIHGSTAVNGCQVEHEPKDIILLSKVPIIFYRASKSTGVKTINLYILTSQRVLIQLTILIQKSGWQSRNKDRTGNHLKLKTYNWSYQNTTHSWQTTLFLSRLVYPTTILKRLR